MATNNLPLYSSLGMRPDNEAARVFDNRQWILENNVALTSFEYQTIWRFMTTFIAPDTHRYPAWNNTNAPFLLLYDEWVILNDIIAQLRNVPLGQSGLGAALVPFTTSTISSSDIPNEILQLLQPLLTALMTRSERMREYVARNEEPFTIATVPPFNIVFREVVAELNSGVSENLQHTSARLVYFLSKLILLVHRGVTSVWVSYGNHATGWVGRNRLCFDALTVLETNADADREADYVEAMTQRSQIISRITNPRNRTNSRSTNHFD